MGMGCSLLLWMLFNGLNEVIPMGQLEISSLKISTKELISSVLEVKNKYTLHTTIPDLST